MASQELRASWQRTEQHLRDALRYQELPDDAKAMATEFIEHNEFCVAFEWIVSVLVERGIAADERARASLAAAFNEMDLDSNPDWSLRARSVSRCRSATPYGESTRGEPYVSSC